MMSSDENSGQVAVSSPLPAGSGVRVSPFEHGLAGAAGLQFSEPCIFELGAPGRHGASVGALDVPAVNTAELFGSSARTELAGLPEVSEPEAVRHFVRLSQWNFCIDSQFYPWVRVP